MKQDPRVVIPPPGLYPAPSSGAEYYFCYLVARITSRQGPIACVGRAVGRSISVVVL